MFNCLLSSLSLSFDTTLIWIFVTFFSDRFEGLAGWPLAGGGAGWGLIHGWGGGWINGGV